MTGSDQRAGAAAGGFCAGGRASVGAGAGCALGFSGAIMSPRRKVGSDATSIAARPNASLPLQVQPGTSFLRKRKALARPV